MFLKIVVAALSCISYGYILKFICRNIDLTKLAPDEIRHRCNWYCKWCARSLLFAIGFFYIDEKDVDYDYTEYLGENYDKKERPCTLVSNHVSWIDVIYFLFSEYHPSYIAKDAIAKIPLLGTMGQLMNCIYIDREASKENKNKIIEDIVQRQEEMEDGKIKFHVLIFPEGTTSNGYNMMEFKRGGFIAMKPVKPMYIKYSGNNIHPSWEVLPFAVHAFLFCSQLWARIEVRYLPIFVPNDHLLKAKKGLADTKEMIFAESVREIIEESSGIKRSDEGLKSKKEYLGILFNQKDFT
jgi:lysophosphatidylcholine acyltransferase/lyso-PAF acetyltransferase